MAKVLLIIAVIAIIIFLIVAMYCIWANREASENSRINNKTNSKKQLCPMCRTGKDSFELDRFSDVCPYIEHWKNGECEFFIPLDEHNKKKIP